MVSVQARDFDPKDACHTPYSCLSGVSVVSALTHFSFGATIVSWRQLPWR